MKILETTKAFDKGLKKVRKYPNFKQAKFDKAVKDLLNGNPLDPTYKDHKAVENSINGWGGSRIFHAAPDIVVIYLLTKDKILLQAIGSHADLFEQLN